MRADGGAAVRVLMVGAAPEGWGGISTVIALVLAHRERLHQVRLRHVVTHRDGSAVRRIWVFLVGATRVVGLVAARRVDVVHLHVSERGSLIRKGLLLRTCAALGVPVVLHIHGAEFGAELATMGPRRRLLVRGVLSRARLVAVLGEGAVGAAVAAGADPATIHVVANPVARPASVPARGGSGRTRVLFLGRLIDRKGVSDLISAVASLDDDARRSLRVSMFGDGPVHRTAELIHECGVQDTVSVSGWLTPAQRDEELARSEVFVLPSYHEGLPMALLEAMAWGVAPLVTPVGGVPTVVTDGIDGLLVPPGDRDALATALTQLAGDRDLRARLGAAARQTSRRYDIGDYVAGWESTWVRLGTRPDGTGATSSRRR